MLSNCYLKGLFKFLIYFAQVNKQTDESSCILNAAKYYLYFSLFQCNKFQCSNLTIGFIHLVKIMRPLKYTMNFYYS